MRIIKLLFVLFACSIKLPAQITTNDLTNLTGYYFGQKPPGAKPEVFAPDILNRKMGYHSSIVFSPDLTFALWCPMDNNNSKLLCSRMIDGKWTKLKWTNFGVEQGIFDPTFSPNGNKIFFLSFCPDKDGKNNRKRLWYVEKTEDGWSKAQLIDEVVYDHPTHWPCSVAKNGNLYFTSEINGNSKQDIYVSFFDNGKYLPPITMGSEINGNLNDFAPYIAPDESYLIFTRLDNYNGTCDLYISFKKERIGWTKAINMGPKVNSEFVDLAPYVSPDGKYLFFISQRERMNGIMWMSAEIINELKRKN